MCIARLYNDDFGYHLAIYASQSGCKYCLVCLLHGNSTNVVGNMLPHPPMMGRFLMFHTRSLASVTVLTWLPSTSLALLLHPLQLHIYATVLFLMASYLEVQLPKLYQRNGGKKLIRGPMLGLALQGLLLH